MACPLSEAALGHALTPPSLDGWPVPAQEQARLFKSGDTTEAQKGLARAQRPLKSGTRDMASYGSTLITSVQTSLLPFSKRAPGTEWVENACQIAE